MKQVTARAVAGFEHNGSKKPGDIFSVSEMHAAQLKAKGLIEIEGEGCTGQSAGALKAEAPEAPEAPAAAAAPESAAPAVQAEKSAGGKRGGK